jgi:hypothetical protein
MAEVTTASSDEGLRRLQLVALLVVMVAAATDVALVVTGWWSPAAGLLFFVGWVPVLTLISVVLVERLSARTSAENVNMSRPAASSGGTEARRAAHSVSPAAT